MIKISNLHVEREGNCICAVESLQVASGERLGIFGANGSGKTTLLRVLAGLTKEYSGVCRIAAEQRQRTYLHQQPYLFRGTVAANAHYGERYGAGQGTAAQRSAATECPSANEWLDRLGIGHLADRSTTDLSGGERRRVALARALATRPQLLLLDEPLADLDDEATTIVCGLLAQLTNTTIVIASPIALPEGLVDNSFSLSSAC